MTDPAVERTARFLEDLTPSTKSAPPARWAVVEIFGHRCHVGRISEVDVVGTKMLRVDVPKRSPAPLLGEPEEFETFLYGGAAIFSLTLISEQAARERNSSEPVRTYLSYDPESEDEEVG